MFNNKRVRGVWWACAALAVLLAAGCVSAASEESGGSAPASGVEGRAGPVEPSLVDGGPGGAGFGGSVAEGGSVSSTVLSSSSSTSTVSGEGELGGGDAGASEVVLEDVLSEEELAKLRKVFSEEELANLREVYTDEALAVYAEVFTEEELARSEMLGRYAQGGAALKEDDSRRILEGSFGRPDFSGASDEYLAALAFHVRAQVDNDPWAIDSNDRSTPVGAFCWVVLKVRMAVLSFETLFFFSHRQIVRLWHVEREAAERGIELAWGTGPVSYKHSLVSALREALAPEVRETVFSPDLPQVLKPWAEALYVLLEEWSAFPVVNLVSEMIGNLLSPDGGPPYRGFEGVAAEELASYWPEETEVVLGVEVIPAINALLRDMDSEEVRNVVDPECKIRTYDGWIENACPPWVAEFIGDCRVSEDEPRWGRLADLYEDRSVDGTVEVPQRWPDSGS